MGKFSTSKKRGRPKLEADRTSPCDRVIQRRELYAWVRPSTGPDGRGGTIDQDICDGIGQLHALGFFDGHGFEGQDLRDKGREWRDHYVTLLRPQGFKTGSYERMDKSRSEPRYTSRDARFDLVDDDLRGFERSCLLSLLVDPIVGSWPDGQENASWVNAFIVEGLIAKGKPPPHWMGPFRLPDSYDRDKLAAAIRGLCLLVDGTLPARFERRAA
jgi:hypothetical protein